MNDDPPIMDWCPSFSCCIGSPVAWSWSLPGMDLPLSRTLLNLAVVVQGETRE